MFLCTRSQYEKDMCPFCAKVYIKHRKISGFINENLTVQIDGYIPIQLKYGVLLGSELNLFARSSVFNRQKLFDIGSRNCGTLFYESIDSPFLLMKFYLDRLARIIFNFCDKSILPMLLSDTETDCRKYTVCTPINCLSLRTDKIKVILFKETVIFAKKLVEFYLLSVNPYFIIDVFNTYERHKDSTNPYLETDRKKI